MSRRRPRTEEEVEAEVESFGLTNEGAAAIVRLGNTLKAVRKLQREHTELLSPGGRLHPPSPLSQPVWKQTDIEDSSQPELEAGVRGLRLEAVGTEQAEYLQNSSHGVSESLSSQDPPLSSRSRKRALSPIREEEDEEEEQEKQEKKKGGEE